MVLKTIPWPLADGGAAVNPAERIRQSMQAPLAATGVVNLGDLQVTALSTPNMSVNVAPGSLWIPGTQGSTAGEGTNYGAQTAYGTPAFPSTFTSQGCYFDYNDAVVNLAISAANATNPRIDLIVVTVQDGEYSGSANQAILQVIAGTPAGTPAPPYASVPPNSVVLAQVLVGASVTVINSGNITDTRPFATSGDLPRVGSGTYSAKVGTAPPQGTILDIQAGSVIVAVNSSGVGTVNLPHAFPNGVLSTPVGAGDTANGLGSVVAKGATLSTITVQCYQPGGTACPAGNVRIEYQAIGW